MTTKNEKNGMRTLVWGKKFWTSLHFVTMGYPKKPSASDKRNYATYFKLTGDILPCGLCSVSYKKFLKSHPFDSKVMKNRRNLVYHLFKIRNLVNKKLGSKLLKRSDFPKMYNNYDKHRSKGCKKTALGC
jgi:hypothetical protein